MSEDGKRKVVDDMVDATHNPTSLKPQRRGADGRGRRPPGRCPTPGGESSDDPAAQAAAILEESELRVEEGADQADA